MDLSVMRFKHTLPIANIEAVSLNPFVLKIRGEDFLSARDIFINGTAAPRFELLSRGEVLAEVPLSLKGDVIHSISIESSGPSRVSTVSNIDLGISDMSGHVSGISALVQRFVKVLLTTPRSSYANPDEGGGVYAMLGENITVDISEDALRSAVASVEEYLIADPRFFDLPESERLSSAEVMRASIDKPSQTVALSIRITNHLGETSTSEVAI